MSLALAESMSPLALKVDLATAPLAKSYADLTELGVAAVVTDVLAVESSSCTAPDCVVVADWIEIVTSPPVPPPVIGEVTLTAVMSPD